MVHPARRLTGVWIRAAAFGAALVFLFVYFWATSTPRREPAPDPRVSADFEVRFNRPLATDGASSTLEDRRPDWQRDPARGEYPYNPNR